RGAHGAHRTELVVPGGNGAGLRHSGARAPARPPARPEPAGRRVFYDERHPQHGGLFLHVHRSGGGARMAGLTEGGRREGTGNRRWVVGMTGASGAVYGVELVRALLEREYEVHLVISDAGWRVLRDELGWDAARRSDALAAAFGSPPERGVLVHYPPNDVGAAIASGSFRCRGMAVVPCSMGTLAAIATGAADNLLTR